MIESFRNKFNILKAKGINLQYVFDIGAYRGEFTETIKSVWKSAVVFQFEADDRQSKYLDKNAFICLLGDKECEVDFYTLDESKITTGSSIFKENTKYYTDSSTIVLKKKMTTLDIISKSHNFYGNWKDNGLVKLDVQGAELMVLDGAKSFLETKRPRFILMECPITEYNKDAPDFSSYIFYMKNNGYKVFDVFDMNYDNLGNLLQIDLMFERSV